MSNSRTGILPPKLKGIEGSNLSAAHPIAGSTGGSMRIQATPQITWLVNRVFAASAIHAIFARDQLGYWQYVGMFSIWFAAIARIKWKVTP
jgi:hypothetical protein